MAHLEDTVRMATRLPVNDAAFYIAHARRQKEFPDSTLTALRIAHDDVAEPELRAAIERAERLEQYCAIPVHDEAQLRQVVERAKAENPGFSEDSFMLVESRLRRGEEEEAAAHSDPEAKCVSDRPWDEIPWFRKPRFLLASFFLLFPLHLALIWSGDAYHRKRGVVYRMRRRSKVEITLTWVVIVAFAAMKILKKKTAA